MTKLAIVDEIRNNSDLLSLPQALSEVLREMNKPDFSSEALAAIILKDPSLTARILKLANSSFYHRAARITTVHQAVQLLGETTVKCLALSTSVFRPEEIEAASGIEAKTYFSKILTVAAAAEKLAGKISYKATEEAFIAGLLHDIGTMFFLYRHPDQYRKIFKKQTKASNLLEAEVEIFGIDHCEVGYHLATKWRLPEQIADGIKYHHSPGAPEDHPITNILRLASLLTTDTADGFEADVEERLARVNQVAGCLSLSKDDVDVISFSLLSWTATVAEYLGVDIGDLEEMLTRANREIWHTYLMVENLFKERQELTRRLLKEERSRGALESKNIAIATLSHYLNNAAMAVYGRSQLMRMQIDKGKEQKLIKDLPSALDVIDRSIKKIVAVLAEIRDISPVDEVEFLNMSKAMNIDDRIKSRLAKMEKESGLVLPEEAETLVE